MRHPKLLRELLDDPYPLAVAIATARSSARSRAAATCGPTCPDLDPGLDGVHIVVGPDGATRRERHGAESGLHPVLLGVDVGGTFTDAVLVDGDADPHRQGADHSRGPVGRR